MGSYQHSPAPPRLARRLLRSLVGPTDADHVQGSLVELFEVRVSRYGIWPARAWYWRQVLGFALRLRSVRRHARDRDDADGARDGATMIRAPAGWASGLEMLVRGVKLAIRSLLRQPGFAAAAIVTLALGIGANTAIFSVVNGVLIQPLPYADAGSLVVVWPETVSNMRMVDWLSTSTRSFDRISGITTFDFAISGDGDSERISGAKVSTNYFEVMGARPLLGRSFLTEESDPGRSKVVVLSHALWRTRYGGDPEIVGRTIRLDYTWFTVIGVMPRHHRPLEPGHRLWVPQEVEPGTTVGTDETWWIRSRIARLAPGVSVEAAQRELRVGAVRLADEFPADLDRTDAGRATVVTLQTALVGEFGRTIWILLAAVGLLLLIACSNVANLLLARTGVKQREVALRSAIGASRRQVIAHLFTESVVLGVLGGAAGIVMAWATLIVLKSAAPADLPRIGEVGVDPIVLLFGVSLSLLTPLIFGLVPAWRAARLDVRELLSSGGRGFAGEGGSGRLASSLIVAEVAISVVLVIGATLMMKSLWNLRAVDPGFSAEGVLTLQVSVPPVASDSASRTNIFAYRELWSSLAALPGIESVGGIHILPLASGNNRYPYWAQDNEPPAGARAPAANIRVATPGYVDVMRIDLRDGRWFDTTDRLDSRPVMVINNTLATRLWANESPIGKRVRLLDEEAFSWEVIGVIADVNQMGLARDPSGEIYLPHEQWAWPSMFVTMRTDRRPESLVPAVRRAMRDVDDDITISDIATMEQVMAASLASNRFLAGLISVFALLALALGAIGVYGVMAYTVSRRIPEFGVRMALGSSGARVLRSAMAQGLTPVGTGVVLGLGVAWAVTRLLSTLLFGVEPADPATYAQVVAVLMLVGCAASYLPARRASSVEPISALRIE